MAYLRDIVNVQTVYGERVTAGEVSVTPQSQALIVRWPNGGWVWNRPVAVLVERNGTRERIPIVDVTRLIQWGLLGLAAAFTTVGLASRAPGRRNRK